MRPSAGSAERWTPPPASDRLVPSQQSPTLYPLNAMTPQIEAAAALYGYSPEEVLEIALQADVESHEQLTDVLEVLATPLDEVLPF